MRIAEIYKSIQGEGLLTGTPSVFVRASGCNLRCWFCDTPYTSWDPEGRDYSVDEILARIDEWECPHIVITGGEPMLFAELIPLTEALAREGRHITIETAGTLYLPVACNLMSISPKLAGSAPSVDVDARWHHRHERERHRPDVVRRLLGEYNYQLKFVIETPSDCDEVQNYVAELSRVDLDRVLLMPQGTDRDELIARGEWLEPYCLEHGYRFCPRMQIEWFGARRGT